MKTDIIRKLYDYYNTNGKINDAINLFTFLLNDNKFNKWERRMFTNYSKKINKYLLNNEINYDYDLTKEELKIEDNNHQVRIAGQGRNCEVLLKGIRNGIVHLNAKLKKKNKITYIDGALFFYIKTHRAKYTKLRHEWYLSKV